MPRTLRTVLAIGLGLVAAPWGFPQEGGEEAIVRYPGLEVDLAGGEVRARGRILIDRGLIELIATAPGGKEHESLLVLDCRPSQLHLGLLLLGLEKGTGARFPGEPVTPSGHRVDLFVAWDDPQGESRVAPIEEFIWDTRRDRTMSRQGWVFIGSRFLAHPQTGRDVFMADATGVMIVTYHDPDAILDTASPAGADDTAFRANPETMPPPGTVIELRIRPREVDGRSNE